MSGPRKAASVWPEMPCVSGPKGAERLQRLVPVLRADRDACAARREAVLRHEWARRRLCHILGIARPEQWNGYVSPAENALPIRGALVALLDEIDEHEREMHEIGGAGA